ncbi:TPA: hypothetical protein ACVEY8_004039 [Yersinia enterocolitica]|uniref:hypothetical protein n=1 Tax=Yersinia enterocolitica TaxID=630 RepID=UPI001C8CF402|nr:hypothetical protein [Yersinia enterocolitica]ELI8161205.1 hypothetical protein [Yersinia enterocolitica]MBX9496765.1 hypothetical protein [Yersinia enterocolitica]HEB2009411.1 hypothetical protein [Yersinia enterocolitica]HEG1706410.1 hypothetical protein [Yersinia enterocolitica]
MKTKWFNANFQKSYDEFYNSIVNTPFNEDRGWGFSINKYDNDSLSSKYIERVELKETITDPYGNETSFEYFKFIQFNFWLIKENTNDYLLIVESAPRSIKGFISNVIIATSSNFNVSNLNIKIEDFIKVVSKRFENVKVQKAKLKGLTFSKHTSGDLEIESSADALEEIKIIFDKSSFKIEKARISLGEIPNKEMIEVNSNGTIIFTEEIFRDISSIIEDINLYK